MGLTVKFEGGAELEASLGELVRRQTEKAVVRRTLLEAAEPIRRAAQELAPDDPETPPIDLHTSLQAGPRTSAGLGDPFQRPGAVVVYMGPVSSLYRYAHAVVSEFGSFKESPHPYMRPAWDSTKEIALNVIELRLGEQIAATAARVAKRKAK